jgi:hypothetical protein
VLLAGCHATAQPASRTKPPATASIRIVATDRGFESPARIPAGLRHIIFQNRGSDVHEAMLVKLPHAMDARAYANAVKDGQLFPKDALDYSGPGLSAPGESVEVWVRVDAGRYVLICWNGDHPSTVPLRAFTVVDDGKADDIPPKEDVVLKMIDFRFELRGVLKRGVQVIRVETPGPSMHEVDIFRLRGDSTVADLNRWRKQEDAGHTPAGRPPADAMGGLLDNHDIRRIAWMRRTFEPGRYVFFCEMPMEGDAASGGTGVSHADAGMSREFGIVP